MPRVSDGSLTPQSVLASLVMAQTHVTFRWFEQHWQPRFDLASRVLQNIEDRWLALDVDFPCRSTLAIILNIFAFDFYAAGFIGYKGIRADDLKRRSLDEWLTAVASAEIECSRLSPKRSRAECDNVVNSLCEILAAAAESWASRSPFEPSCEQVVRETAGVLASGQFVTIHYGH